mmetsp:Transcript_17441/g.48646  ORF Transcript_17441/g.48646 Transcript_17441/m.48646 type:complete len:232 (+) Transcript_17441:670-1365(+)
MPFAMVAALEVACLHAPCKGQKQQRVVRVLQHEAGAGGLQGLLEHHGQRLCAEEHRAVFRDEVHFEVQREVLHDAQRHCKLPTGFHFVHVGVGVRRHLAIRHAYQLLPACAARFGFVPEAGKGGAGLRRLYGRPAHGIAGVQPRRRSCHTGGVHQEVRHPFAVRGRQRQLGLQVGSHQILRTLYDLPQGHGLRLIGTPRLPAALFVTAQKVHHLCVGRLQVQGALRSRQMA